MPKMAASSCSDDLASLPFGGLPVQRQFPACGACKTVILFIVLHILNLADLLLEFLRFLMLVIGWHNKAHLPIFLQI